MGKIMKKLKLIEQDGWYENEFEVKVEAKLRLFGAPWCKMCDILAEKLYSHGVDFEKVDIGTDEGAKMVEGLNIKSIPVLVWHPVNGEEDILRECSNMERVFDFIKGPH